MSLTYMIAKCIVKNVAKSAIKGTPISGSEVRTAYKALDILGDQDGVTELGDAVKFIKDEAGNIVEGVVGVIDFLKDLI
ncbi:MAG: hypothetical protein KAX49_19770 [Halanaerobiales bacterium]|nr:hypothetical protein [Halanaerobiales bacterium]